MPSLSAFCTSGVSLTLGVGYLPSGIYPDCSNYHTIALISHASKVMLNIAQARLQQYMNRELLDVQAGFRKGRETRDQIANIHWIIEKRREFQKNIYFCFIVGENSSRDGDTKPSDLPLEKSVCRSGSNS